VHEEHITRLNDVRELIDTLIRLVGVFRLPGAINQAPESRGKIKIKIYPLLATVWYLVLNNKLVSL